MELGEFEAKKKYIFKRNLFFEETAKQLDVEMIFFSFFTFSLHLSSHEIITWKSFNAKMSEKLNVTSMYLILAKKKNREPSIHT